MSVDEDNCECFGLDAVKVSSIARRISRAAREAAEIGLTVFGGSGCGSLRFHRESVGAQNIVATLDGIYDGGDGGDVF